MLLSPTPASPGGPPRMSQLLPTVKCSNCNRPVPLSELGEHICSTPPPVPSLPAKNNSNSGGGMKSRLQGLLSTPAAKPAPLNPIPSPPTSPNRLAATSPTSPNRPSPSRSTPPNALPPPAQSPRPFAHASGRKGSTSSFQARSSPLARSFSEESNDDYFSSRERSPSTAASSMSVPSSPAMRERAGTHTAGMGSVSTIRSVLSSRSGSSSGGETVRDTMHSTSSNGYGDRDTLSPGPGPSSFMSFGDSRPNSPSKSPTMPPKSPPATFGLSKSPTSPSPLSASQSPLSPRIPIPIPEPRTSSPLSPLAALSSAAAASSMTMTMSLPSSSSAPAVGSAGLSPQPQSHPHSSFSSSPSSPVISRNIPPSLSRLPPSSIPISSPNHHNGPSPPRGMASPAPSLNQMNQAFPPSHMHMASPSVQSVHHNEPDTQIGGAAGMAGVGRRGFAAAARAALFVNHMGPGPGMGMGQGQGQGVGGNGMNSMTVRRGPFLDIDAAVRTTATPPLTATSLSPQSPGPVSSPLSPLSTSPTSMNATEARGPAGAGEGAFFDKFRNQIPGIGMGLGSSTSPVDELRTATPFGGSATPRAGPSRQDSGASEASTSSSSALSLGLGYSSSSASSKSRSSNANANTHTHTRTRKSSAKLGAVDEDGDTSGSEYGLAYADSTDYEDEDADAEEDRRRTQLSVRSALSGRSRNSRDRDGATPTPGLRSGTKGRPISGSVYSDDDDDDDDLRNRLQLDSSPPSKLSRAKSNASISSVDSASSSTSAAAIAKALGLSRSSSGKVVGGPGAPKVARTPSGQSIQVGRERSGTMSSIRSLKSDGYGRARSATMDDSRSGVGAGASSVELEQAMAGLLGDVSSEVPRPRGVGLRDDGPSPQVTPPGGFADFTSNGPSRGSKMAHRSNTVGVAMPYTSSTEAAEKMPKLPARSKTERGSSALHPNGHSHHPSPSIASSSASEAGTKKRVKVCVRCDKRIEDGRWVSVEGASAKSPGIGRNGERGDRKDKGVLCERCWKNMYLPKCRRCNLSIEKQAVSSSDGQLKGKYHKDCFNCFKCSKPFPDKIFYVYDGKPLCKYHYHEANESLCAAAKCGQPIEGPCAVSHAGDRYHPEHLTCEWPGYPECDELLNREYWELEGRMLCEKHAKGASDAEDEYDTWDSDGGRASRAMKRMTKFIDLGDLR